MGVKGGRVRDTQNLNFAATPSSNYQYTARRPFAARYRIISGAGFAKEVCDATYMVLYTPEYIHPLNVQQAAGRNLGGGNRNCRVPYQLNRLRGKC